MGTGANAVGSKGSHRARRGIERLETAVLRAVRLVGPTTLRYHRDFVQDGRPIWHYNQTPEEYDGSFDSTLTFTGPFGSYTKQQWPKGSAYPDYFVIGDPHLNFYEGSATIDDLKMYVPAS